jgi:hypothetical protein
MREKIKAYAQGDDVIYEYTDGYKERWSDGTRAWRNGNPGNVKFDKKNDWDGQVGKAGGFCVFEEPKWGERATKHLLRVYAGRRQTLGEGIYSYAPPSDNNDTEAYNRFVAQVTGIHRDTKLSDVLNRVEDIAEAIFKHEGYREGTIEVLEEGKKTGRYIWRTHPTKTFFRGGPCIFYLATLPQSGHLLLGLAALPQVP